MNEDLDVVIGIVSDAKEIISKPEKWIKHKMFTDDGCSCAWGAIMKAAPANQYYYQWSVDEFKKSIPIGFKTIPGFNDHPATKHEDVMEAFDKTIKRLELQRL